MTKREVRHLFAAWRQIAKPDFWFWLPLDPVTGFQLLVVSAAAFINDLARIILIPEEIRRREDEGGN